MIAIGSDHGGYALKQEVIKHLEKKGIEYQDFGCYNEDSCDYPVYAKLVTKEITEGNCEKGILICGTGIGISIAANKVPGIRAALCTDCVVPWRKSSRGRISFKNCRYFFRYPFFK